ncbi:MAG: hypothetical protein LIO71_01670 [Ruminococcus sp.]|nr:hypothetical protein [Ruminococcus sp.]MCD7799864.1 hypothetical protein [Ruminococcus sp.]
MSNIITLRLTTSSDIEYVLNDILSFKIVREYYTPYNILTVKAVYPRDISVRFKKVELILNGEVIHTGLVDTCIVERVFDFETINIKSKSFTVLLCQNQLAPELKSNVSLSSLIDSFITIPEISHEDNEDVVNYIYIKNTSTLWDAVINLTHKINGGHPYIRESNKVMVSLLEDASIFNLSKSLVTSTGSGLDTTKIISDIHMQDIDGNYDTYNLNNPLASDLNIVRHKHIDLDRQYLSNPSDALIYKLNFSMRGYYFVYATYNGYLGEDIGDYVNFYNYFPKSRVSKLEITGKDGNVSTKVYAYTDSYLSYEI